MAVANHGNWIIETRRGQARLDGQLPIGYSDLINCDDNWLIMRAWAIVESTERDPLSLSAGVRAPVNSITPHWSSFYPQACPLNDDYNDRMVAIDPRTARWSSRVRRHRDACTAAGLLNTPDGFDILGRDSSTPTHTATG